MERRDAIDAFRMLLDLDAQPPSPPLEDDESMAEEMLNIDALLWPPTGDEVELNSSVSSTQVMSDMAHDDDEDDDVSVTSFIET